MSSYPKTEKFFYEQIIGGAHEFNDLSESAQAEAVTILCDEIGPDYLEVFVGTLKEKFKLNELHHEFMRFLLGAKTSQDWRRYFLGEFIAQNEKLIDYLFSNAYDDYLANEPERIRYKKEELAWEMREQM